MRRRLGVAVVALAIIASTALALGPIDAAGAHGVADQSAVPPSSGQECSAAEFPGSKLLTTGESRQSFVPSRGGIASLDLCIGNLIGVLGTDFTVALYAGDNPAAPNGPALASVPVDAGTAILASQWVHVDFPVEVPTTPGASYIIGLAPASGVVSSVTFQWRATCDGLLVPCSGSTNTYAAGRPSDLDANADYGFRTFPLHAADLVGSTTVPALTCPGRDLSTSTLATVTNVSQTSVGSFATEWVWSTDAVHQPTDRVIGTRTTVAGLPAGGSAGIPGPPLPADLPPGEGHLLLRIDVENRVVEANDLNNLVAGRTTVTQCGQPAISGLALTVTEGQVPTGFHQRHFADLDPAGLATLPQSPEEAAASPAFSPTGFSPTGFSPTGFSSNLFSQNGYSPTGFSPTGFSPTGFSPTGFSPTGFSPTGFSPTGFSPTGFSPTGFSPAGSLPLARVLADVPTSILEGIPVVLVPIAGVGWAERFGTGEAETIQGLTLADAVAQLPDLEAGEVDLRGALPISALALALAGSPLNATPPADGRSHCTWIAELGSSCSQLGVDPATTSLLALEVRFPTAFRIPIATVPLTGISLTNALVRDVPIAGQVGLTFQRRFNWEHTRLGQLPVSAAMTDPETVVQECAEPGVENPQAFNCDLTFVDAARAGALRDVDFGTVLDGLSAAGRAGAIVGDLGSGLLADSDLRLSAANWNRASSLRMDPACPSMTYHLTGANVGTADAVDPTATVTLAPGFVYVPGSTSLVEGGGQPVAQPDPASSTSDAGVRTYTFAIDAEINGGFDLTFRACASVYLGAFVVGSAQLAGSGLDGPYQGTTAGQADLVEVVERTPGVTTTALAGGDNIVVADHISETNAHDVWTFPVQPGRVLYKVQLIPPPGVDLDLIGYGPAVSADGFSPTGFSPTGFSPTGFSPTGFSPTGFSPTGFSPTGFSPTGFSPTGFSTLQPDLLQDLPIEELRPDGSFGTSVSAHRGDEVESLYLVSNAGDTGNLSFAVADYDAWGNAPYFLTVQTIRAVQDPRLATCQAAPFSLDQARGPAPAAWTGTTGPRTLFVTNRQVTASLYGAAAADAGIAALQSLAARPEIAGIVVQADHDAQVRDAMANWRVNWCDPAAANRVGTQIRRLILDLRQQHPTIDTVVLAGGDAVVPDFRLTDRSPMYNEDQYLDALLNATGGNNALVAAYAHGTIPSTDPYGNDAALPFGQSYAFPPSAGVSRLVEGPADWIAQRDQYVAAGGLLDPQDGFVSGFRGNVDGAQAAAQVLNGLVDVPPVDVLTDTDRSWSSNDFRSGAFTDTPDVAGYNAHTNHFALLSDLGSDNRTQDLVTTSEAGAIPMGGLIFSNGCHFGTAVTDALNPGPDAYEAARLRDWPQAITAQRRGIAVANSGFGIFDTEVIGHGERLFAQFLEELATAPNASIALARAKNHFFATAGVFDPFTFKTLQQTTMYGLGIFLMEGASRTPAAVTRPPATTSIDVSAGTYSVAAVGNTTCTDCYRRRTTASGLAIDVVDADVEPGHTSVPGYASSAISSQWDPLPAGMASAGAWITGYETVALGEVDPVITRLAVSGGDQREPQLAAPFPTAPAQVNDVGPYAVTTLSHQLTVPTRMVDGRVRANVFLHTDIDAEVLLRPASTPRCDPHVDEVTIFQSPNGALVMIDVVASEACGPANGRAAALVRDDAGETTYRELSRGANGHWTGAVALGPGATRVEDVLVEVTNGIGVGYHRFKGDSPTPRVTPIPTPGLSVNIAGPLHATGVYLGSVTATIDTAPGSSCEVYDNGHQLGTFGDGATVPITTDGVHELGVYCSNGGRYAGTFAIDQSTPAIVWPTPTNGAVVEPRSTVLMDFACPDTGTAATCSATMDGQPIADGAPINTTALGAHTLRVTATDLVGHSVSETRTYTVRSSYTMSAFHSPIVAKPTLNNVSPSSSIAVKFTVTDRSGNAVSDPAVIADRFWYAINCSNKARSGSPVRTTGTTPTYSSYFHFNIAAPAPLGCYELVVQLIDGTQQTAYFRVRR